MLIFYIEDYGATTLIAHGHANQGYRGCAES